MTWGNIGEWEVHHNIPISWFKPDTPPAIVNNLNNLYPISKQENRNIKNKYIRTKPNSEYLKQTIPWIKKCHLSIILTYL